MNNGTAWTAGPVTMEQKADYGFWMKRKAEFEAEFACRQADPDPRARIEEDIQQATSVPDIIRRALRDEGGANKASCVRKLRDRSGAGTGNYRLSRVESEASCVRSGSRRPAASAETAIIAAAVPSISGSPPIW